MALSSSPQTFWHQGPVSWKINFPVRVRMVFGQFQHVTFIMHFISVITTSAPPQIIRSPEVGDPDFVLTSNSELGRFLYDKSAHYTVFLRV